MFSVLRNIKLIVNDKLSLITGHPWYVWAFWLVTQVTPRPGQHPASIQAKHSDLGRLQNKDKHICWCPVWDFTGETQHCI